MNVNSKKFIALVVLLLLARASDGLTTYIASPDLLLEMNPLVSVLKGSWLSLILMNLFIISLVIYAAYVYYFRPPNYAHIPVEAKKSLLAFNTYAALGSGARPVELLYKLPNSSFAIRSLGFIGGYGLIWFSIFLVLNNIAVGNNLYLYNYWIAKLGTFNVLFVVLVIILSVVAYFFAKNEFYHGLNSEPNSTVA